MCGLGDNAKLLKIQYPAALRIEQGFSVENIFSVVAVEPK
jgi:hypothetical protein